MNRFFRSLAAAALALGVAGLVSPAARAADDAAKPAAATGKPIRVLLVLGGCCHDYAKQKEILTQGISARANVEVTVAYDPDKGTKHLNPVYEKDDWCKGFDVVIHDECSADVKDLAVIDKILKPHKDGIPAVVLHCGMHCYRSEGWPKTVTPWFEFTGLQTTGHGSQLPIAVSYVDKESPITKGLADWTTINEELYNNIAGKVLDTAKPLARGKQVSKDKAGKESTAETVVVWTNLYAGKTKVFATTLGHNNVTVGDARYLNLVTAGMLWSLDKLDAEHFKPSDQNVDVKAIKAEAPAQNGQVLASGELLRDVKCCGQE
jgi:type 1 glutamine amidotransferase